MKKNIIILVLFSFLSLGFSPSYKLAVLKYRGGGDWYANPTSMTNLIGFCNEVLKTNINPYYDVVEAWYLSLNAY